MKQLQQWNGGSAMEVFRSALKGCRLTLSELDLSKSAVVDQLLVHFERRQLRWYRNLIRMPPRWRITNMSYQEEPRANTGHTEEIISLDFGTPPCLPGTRWMRWVGRGSFGLLCWDLSPSDLDRRRWMDISALYYLITSCHRMIVRRKTITPVGIFLINDYALPAFCGHIKYLCRNEWRHSRK